MSSLRDAILSTASRQAARWIDRLPEADREDLLSIRRDWQAGVIHASCRGLAASIIANCKERGIELCGLSGVREWLAKQD